MARKDTKLDHLARVRLFSACSKKELNTIGRASDEITVPAGKVLCEEGKPGHEFYLVLEGGVSVRRGKRKLTDLGPGRHFGELALLHRGPRNATVVADQPSTLLVLGQREFSGVLDEVPSLAHKLLTYMAERLAEADSKEISN
jgi:CRP/FNR family transcriptional regulator, cyclic AMP receptor protein